MNISRSLAARLFSTIAITALAALVLSAVEGCAPAPAAAPAPTAAPPTAAPIATTAPAATVAPTAALVATTAASSATDPTSVIKLGRIQNFGLFLTDGADRTLYATDNDKKDTSTCTGNCLQNWPAFIVRATPQAAPPLPGTTIGISATLISTFTRADGTMQVEYDGRPLYYFSGDKNPGDVNGHNVGNVWHVLSPRGSPMTNPAPTKAP